jgi:hypothetical protein
VILNRHQNPGIISEAQIEKVIGQKIFWKVPNQYIQMRSISGAIPEPGGQFGSGEEISTNGLES